MAGSTWSGCFGSQAEEARSLRDLRKIGILQVSGKIEKAAGLHFQFDKGERIIS